MKNSKTTLCILCSMILFSAFSQPEFDAPFSIVQQQSDEIKGFAGEQPDMTLEINLADSLTLLNCYCLDADDVFEILNYRKNHGALLGINEIDALPLDFEKKLCLKEIVAFKNERTSSYFSGWNKRAIHHALELKTSTRLEREKGIRNGSYANWPYRNGLRYQLQWAEKLKFFFATEQDRGEPIQKKAGLSIPDYINAGAQLEQPQKSVKKVLVGPYKMFWNQGVACWKGFSVWHQLSTNNQIRASKTFSPHRSYNESEYLYGVAAHIQRVKIHYYPFFSRRRKDIRVDTLKNGQTVLSTRYNTGVHRSELQQKWKDRVSEFIGGIMVKAHFAKLKLMLGTAYTYYGPGIHHFSAYGEKYPTKGMINTLGLTWMHKYHQFNFEVATNQAYSPACIATYQYYQEAVKVSTSLRYFSPAYFNPFSAALKSYSRSGNEWGFFQLWTIKPMHIDRVRIGLNIYGPVHAAPESIYSGTNYGLNFQLKKQLGNAVYCRLRMALNKRSKRISQGNTRMIGLKTTGKLGCSINLKINQTLISYVPAFSWIRRTRFRGQTHLLKIKYHGTETWDVEGRLYLFQVDQWQNRIYMHESGIPGSFSLPAFYDAGERFSLRVRKVLFEHIRLWAKISYMSFNHGEHLGSGKDEINYPHRTDVSMLVRYRF